MPIARCSQRPLHPGLYQTESLPARDKLTADDLLHPCNSARRDDSATQAGSRKPALTANRWSPA